MRRRGSIDSLCLYQTFDTTDGQNIQEFLEQALMRLPETATALTQDPSQEGLGAD
jgi:hypothetical protein